LVITPGDNHNLFKCGPPTQNKTYKRELKNKGIFQITIPFQIIVNIQIIKTV